MHFIYEHPCLVERCTASSLLEAFSVDHAKIRVVRACRNGHRVAQEVPRADVDSALTTQLNDGLLAGLVELGVIGGVE